MSDADATTPDVGAAVQALKPQLTRISTTTLLVMTAVGIVTLVAVIAALNLIDDGDDRFKFAMVAAVFGVLAIVYAHSRMRRAQEALVMPEVARAVGLTYDKDAGAFLRGLPERLLPRAAVRMAEDHVRGTFGRHSLEMAEVKIATGGKNSVEPTFRMSALTS